MDSTNFCYWLNGFVELNDGKLPTAGQWKSIIEHLNLVFGKITPPVVEQKLAQDKPTEIQDKPFDWQEYLKKMNEQQRQPIPYTPYQHPWQYPTTPWPNDLIVTC